MPPDLARGNERIRTRFLSNLMVNPSAWRIAKALLPHYSDGYGDAGLRGVMNRRTKDLTWWISHQSSHGQAYHLLGIPRDEHADHLEIEINTLANGTMYPCWQRCGPGEEADFLAHPIMTGLVDGCLAHGGRQLRLRDGRVNLLAEPAATDDVVDHQAVRQPYWEALSRQAAQWARSRRRTAADGSAMPVISSIRPYRHWLEEQTGWRSRNAVPSIAVTRHGAIVASWRAPCSFARMRFEDDRVSLHANLDGRIVEIEPRGNRTQRERDAFPHMAYFDALRRMRSSHDDMELPVA